MVPRRVRRTAFWPIGLALVSVLACSCCGSTGTERQTSPTPQIEIGRRVRLKEETPLCSTKADLDELKKVFVSKDEFGFSAMLLSGHMFYTSMQTQVLVIDYDGSWNWFQGAAKVRVLEGEHLGKAGWTFAYYLE